MSTNDNDHAIKIFYSWQSDLPNATNRQAIRTALKAACVKADSKYLGYKFEVIEATTREPGSPEIPATIMQKISTSDIFACDVTTINKNIGDEKRKTPNPNVVFELGYAVAHLGWERVILFFNEEYGDNKTDLPFDLEKRRLALFKLAEGDKPPSNLAQISTDAICLIHESNPAIRFGRSGSETTQIKRKRDVEAIQELLVSIRPSTIDEMYATLPLKMKTKYLNNFSRFDSIFDSATFHLYDKEIFSLFKLIYTYYEKCVSFGKYYFAQPSLNELIFQDFVHDSETEQRQHAWDEIESSVKLLRETFKKLVSDINERYLELNFDSIETIAYVEQINRNQREASRANYVDSTTKAQDNNASGNNVKI